MRRTLAPLVLAASLVMLANAPAAATTPPPAERTLEYEGSHVQTSTDPVDGESHTGEPVEHTTRVRCDDAGCVVFTPAGDIPLVDGTGRLSTPARGSVCAGDWHGAETTTVTATATTLAWAVETAGSAVEDCGEGSTQWMWASSWVFEGSLVSGDACALDGSCPAAAAPPGGGTAGSGGAAGRRDIAAPTVFSGLPTAAAAVEPGNLVWALVGTVILALLIGLPTYFFNSAAETVSERMSAWWARRRPHRSPGGLRRGPAWLPAALLVLAAALVSTLADPAFALDAAAARVFVSIAVSFALEVCLGWAAVILLVRRTHPDAVATYRVAPLSLVVVAAAVLLTRLSGFEPPVLFGLVAGLAFVGITGAAAAARITLLTLGWAFGIGLASWIGYSVLVAAGGPLVVTELLAAAAIAGMSTLPLALLPVRGLPGRSVWEWSRPAWAAAYALGMLAFLLVLLPLPASWEEVGLGLGTWIGLYLLYAGGAVVAWLIVARPWRRARAAVPTGG